MAAKEWLFLVRLTVSKFDRTIQKLLSCWGDAMPSDGRISNLFPIHSGAGQGSSVLVSSPFLGSAKVSLASAAIERLPSLNGREKAMLRRYIWAQAEYGLVPVIDIDAVEYAIKLPSPRFMQLFKDTLRFVERNTKYPGVSFMLDGSPQSCSAELATILCLDLGNYTTSDGPIPMGFAGYYLDELFNNRYIERHDGNGSYQVKLLPPGQMALESEDSLGRASTQGFIAMWFSPEMEAPLREGLVKGIEGAGYKAAVVDQNHHHEGTVNDEIIAQIRRSKFVVADFTCDTIDTSAKREFIVRGGVYFEAGYALALGKPVIWTARKNCLDGLHFDTRQFPHILWDEPDELKAALQARIEAFVGRGPLAPP
ncbi:MAG: hypothetical protein KF735_08600 [Chelatococcus sp.]|uniref:hypothetical protein n=1 Tax=Chelatococcus sp. TaxID=1953771 RepID=UPI0025C1D74B|nr:hypothetical protein [Chelatococcus sp.]MBX3537683.1 hypothetical protein [Chelatococcus sp.]